MMEHIKDFKNETKAIFLLERTKDDTSHIIGFYSTEKRAIEAVKRHVNATIDSAVKAAQAHGETDRHTGIYVQEGFLISRNDVEIDTDAEFTKIEDAEEFPFPRPDPLTHRHHVAEDLGDVKDPVTEDDVLRYSCVWINRNSSPFVCLIALRDWSSTISTMMGLKPNSTARSCLRFTSLCSYTAC